MEINENINTAISDSDIQRPLSSDETEDVKPLFLTRYFNNSSDDDTQDIKQTSTCSTKKWFPGKWQDASRKSAFQPYKQTECTVLTNRQRGNIQAEAPVPEEAELGFHTRAGQGEISIEDIKNEPHIDVRDSNGLTALHWAAAYGQLMSVTLLLDAGAKIDTEGPDGETPLLLAASGGHHDVVRLLLTKGALVNQTDHIGNTPLMYAAYGNHPHCCNELLLRGADMTIYNMYEDTAFSLASDNNSNLAQAVIENYLLTLLSPIS